MSRRLIALFIVLISACLGCTWMEDNGTHLAYALQRGAKNLNRSDATEERVRYEPLTGTQQTYYIEMQASPPNGTGMLNVGGKRGGSTTFHQRFVYVPQRLYIEKTNAAAELLLKKQNNRIEVVELR